MAAGCFSRQNGRLRYEPSGREPIIIAGSGRGFPSHPRGIIKRLRGNLSACFLTETYLAECRKKDRLQVQSFWVFKKKWNMCITLA